MSTKNHIDQIRAGLTAIHKERGALKLFAAKHELNYNHLYRIIKGNIISPSYEVGLKIFKAVESDIKQFESLKNSLVEKSKESL